MIFPAIVFDFSGGGEAYLPSEFSLIGMYCDVEIFPWVVPHGTQYTFGEIPHNVEVSGFWMLSASSREV